jgi:hypothetical protein
VDESDAVVRGEGFETVVVMENSEEGVSVVMVGSGDDYQCNQRHQNVARLTIEVGESVMVEGSVVDSRGESDHKPRKIPQEAQKRCALACITPILQQWAPLLLNLYAERLCTFFLTSF